MLSFLDVESAQRSSQSEEVARRGIEAQESSNLALYTLALQHDAARLYAEAAGAYSQLLEQPLITGADRERAAPGDPSLMLHFLALKNLSALESRGDDKAPGRADLLESALQHALHALAIDDTDGLLWLRLGRLASQTGRVSLARHALEQVRVSPSRRACAAQKRSLADHDLAARLTGPCHPPLPLSLCS